MILRLPYALAVLFSLLLLSGCVTETTGGVGSKASKSRAVEQYVDVGAAYLSEREYDLAMQRIERALELNPKHPRAHAVLGLIYQSQLETEKAEAAFRQALSYNGDFTLGRTYYAAFLYQEKRYEESLKQLKLASSDIAFANRAQVFSNMGRVYNELGQTDNAIEAYQRSIRLLRSQPQAYLSLAELHFQKQEYQKASNYYYVFWDRIRNENLEHSPKSLKLGVEIARALGDKNKEASLILFFKNEFPNSAEYRQLAREN